MLLLIGAFTIGLILSLLALGVFISFRIFDFPDITADGSITLGAAVTAVLILAGVHPLAALAAAFAAGVAAGTTTGVLHTRFKINGLLSGILVMTALYSVNLRIMGKSNVPLLSERTLVTIAESAALWALAHIDRAGPWMGRERARRCGTGAGLRRRRCHQRGSVSVLPDQHRHGHAGGRRQRADDPGARRQRR